MKNNTKFSKTERGQALVIITFAIIGLIAMTGLVVDGSLAYADRRNAQNAADSAAMSAALAHVRGADYQQTAQGIAAANGYDNVTITSAASPSGCPVGTTDNKDITVQIVSKIDTTFATVVGIKQMTNTVTATSRACGTYIAPIFGGNAIVGLNPGPDCAFDSDTGDAEWVVTGGGIFSNGCAVAKGNVTLDSDQCVGAVGAVDPSDFNNQVCTGTINPYDQKYINSIMPPNPCVSGGVGLPQPVLGKKDTEVRLTNGVYCITNFGIYDRMDIILDNATLYVTDDEFNLNFSGDVGGFSGTATETGVYENYFLVIEPDPDGICSSFTSQKNDQVVRYIGNSSGSPYGTVLAPTACIDLRGNGAADINGQVIGYEVSANGTADTTINYEDDQNHQDPVDPTLQLLK